MTRREAPGSTKPRPSNKFRSLARSGVWCSSLEGLNSVAHWVGLQMSDRCLSLLLTLPCSLTHQIPALAVKSSDWCTTWWLVHHLVHVYSAELLLLDTDSLNQVSIMNQGQACTCAAEIHMQSWEVLARQFVCRTLLLWSIVPHTPGVQQYIYVRQAWSVTLLLPFWSRDMKMETKYDAAPLRVVGQYYNV